MVCDDSFSCALRGKTLRVRGAPQYVFIAESCPGPGGLRDEAGAPTIALLWMRTPFTNSATLSVPLLGA